MPPAYGPGHHPARPTTGRHSSDTSLPEPVTHPDPHPPGLRRVLATPHVTPLLVGTLIGRLPTAMAPIALLLAVRAEDGPLLLGATLAALYGLASAIGQPLLGRLVDRTRTAPVVAASATVSTASFTALAVLGCTPQPVAAAFLAVLAGAATPPLEPWLRAMWPRLVAAEDERAAFTLDSTSQEMVFVAGPLAVTALCQLTSPAAALAVCAAAGAAGALAVATRQPARCKPRPRPSTHWSGPLRSRGLLLLLLAMAALGVNLGSFNVLAITLADRHASGWLAGILPAALAVGSLIGGLVHARSPWPVPLSRQMVLAAGGYALCFAPMLFATAPAVAVALSACPGLYLAPMLAISFILSDRLAPPGTTTEAAAWMIAVIGVGHALGTAAAGRLADHGPAALAVLPVLAAALAAAVVLARTDLLTPANTPTETSA
ncbi:MFS transporter [Kitasatospora sp. NPDC058032]|uniref:MFS transporter n=1 Tax=Kitasatospora sp. NPDC058032 TaxID=3346307 RepID=UPI0036DE028B